jgi:hypothetical protein
MKKFRWALSLIILLTACGQAPTPAAPTQDVQATISALSGTMVAATIAAQPSATTPPTETPLPSPTLALLPTETATPELTGTPTPGGPTPTAWVGSFIPLNTDGLPTGLLRIENLTGEKEIIVTLQGVTLTRDRPVYYSYVITGALNITIFWARYTYTIQIPNKKIYTGSFTQGNDDKTTIRVYLKKDPAILGP